MVMRPTVNLFDLPEDVRKALLFGKNKLINKTYMTYTSFGQHNMTIVNWFKENCIPDGTLILIRF